jgi:hypothetical protein
MHHVPQLVDVLARIVAEFVQARLKIANPGPLGIRCRSVSKYFQAPLSAQLFSTGPKKFLENVRKEF